MRKIHLLLLGFLILSLNGFAAPYAWYPYGGSAAAAYAVPDATCDQLYEIENFKNKGYSSSFAGIPGRELIQFDQVSASAGGSTYAAEYGFTCGASPAGTAATYTNFRTEWVSASMDPKVGKWNIVPETLEGTVGAYFWHTVNFTQIGDYKFLFRIRGNANTTTAVVTNSTVVVTLYAKSDVSTPLATKTIKIDGMKYNKLTDGTYGTGLIGNQSTDNSAEYAADGNFGTAVSQAAPEWVRGTSAINITTPGEYVVKISQTVGAGTQGIGGFTFQKVATSPILYTTAPVSGITTVEGNASSSKLINIAGAALTGFPGTLTVTGSTNFEVSSDNVSFASAASVNYTSATLSTANIYVRLKATATAGSYTENVTIGGGGASDVTVSASGDVTTSPTITLTGTLTAFANTVNGDVSAEKTYTLSGSFLTSDITVTAPEGFSVSKSSGSGFASSIAYAQSGGTVSAQTVYVRFEPSAVQAYSGNITHISTGATQKDQAVSGTGISAAPSISIGSPATNTTAVIGGNLVLTATAIPTGSRTISSVVFKDGIDVISGTVTQNGNDFSITYANFPSGSRSITAIATDNQSNVTTSTAIAVRGITAFTGNKYAHSAITWAIGPWYDAASGGNEVTVPTTGDNVFTNGYAVSVNADATCDNLTFKIATSGSSVANQLSVSNGMTLTVRGKIDGTDMPASGSSHTLYNSAGTGTIKLTGETLSSPFTLIENNAIGADLVTDVAGMFKPVNLVIDPVNLSNTYQFGTSNVNYIHGAGKFTIKANTKLDIKTVMQLGMIAGNELIIESGAEVTTTNHFKGASGNKDRIKKATINGTVTFGDNAQLVVEELVLGNNAYIKTSNSHQTNAAVLTWDGWWGAKSLTTPTPLVTDFGTPASLTLGTNTTIEFAKTGNQNINGIVPANGTTPSIAYSIPYVNLNVSGVGVKTIQTDLIVTGNLNVVTGTTLKIPTGVSLTGSGTFNLNAGATLNINHADGLNVSTGPIRCTTRNFDAGANYVFNGAAAQVTGTEFPAIVNDLTINNAAGVTLSGPLTVNGVLTLTSGALTNGSNLTLGNSASIVRNGGSLGTAPTFGTNKDITFSGSGAIATGNELPSTVTSLTVSNTGGVTLSNPITVSGATSITGKLILANTLTANSAVNVGATATLQLNDGAALAGSGAITYTSGGTLAFNKTANTTIDGTETFWPSSNGPTNVSVLQNTLTLNANKNISGVSVASGATLTTNANKQLTVGTLANAGTVTLKSDANGTATIIPTTVTGSGTFNVEQYLTYTRNYYVSSPVSNAVAPGGYTYYGRYEPGGTATGWTPVSTGDGLTAGKGYIALPTSAGAPITFTTQNGGTLNNGTVTIPLSYTSSVNSGKGYNLIGNPYPSHLSWTYAFTQANSTKIESSIWYRTKAANGNSGGGWSFVTFNPTSELTVPSTENGGLIPPMQAFWVLAKDVVDNSIQFTNDMRSHQTSNPLRSPAAKSLDRKKLRLQVSNGTRADEALIVFDANALDGYDAYDSPKMMNNATDMADIYTIADAKNLVINGMSNVKYNTEIPIGFSTLTANDFSISANEISNFELGTKVILIDKLNPTTEFELTDGMAYNFSAPVTSGSTDRFSLLFRAPGITTGVTATEKPQVQVYVNGNNQITIIAAEKAPYSIYNAVGQLIENGRITSNNQTSNFKLAAGVYVVKVNNVTERVIVK